MDGGVLLPCRLAHIGGNIENFGTTELWFSILVGIGGSDLVMETWKKCFGAEPRTEMNLIGTERTKSLYQYL